MPLKPLKLLVSTIPNCQVCGKRPHSLHARPVVDGATVIMTEWHWVCHDGHATPAGTPDVVVSTEQYEAGFNVSKIEVKGEG